MIECECGCGQEVKSNRRYLYGHNRKGKYHIEETIEKMKKRHPTEETKRKMSISHIKRLTKEIRKGMSCRQLKVWQNPEHRRKVSETMTRLWQDSNYAERQIRASFAGNNLKPTKPERRLRNGLNKMFPGEYKYVGDGQIFIGYKNPDFVNVNGQKKIIELFGDYWHGEERTNRTKKQEETQRINHFKRYGFRTLIVWECELKDISKLRKKLLQFHKAQRVKI